MKRFRPLFVGAVPTDLLELPAPQPCPGCGVKRRCDGLHGPAVDDWREAAFVCRTCKRTWTLPVRRVEYRVASYEMEG